MYIARDTFVKVSHLDADSTLERSRPTRCSKEVVEAEKQVTPEDDQSKALAALTKLFNEARGSNTPVVVERIVADINAIMKVVRFPDW
jgi:hypothetical protein